MIWSLFFFASSAIDLTKTRIQREFHALVRNSSRSKDMKINTWLSFLVKIFLVEQRAAYVIIKDVPVENLATAISHLMNHATVSWKFQPQSINVICSPMHISSHFIAMDGSEMSITAPMTIMMIGKVTDYLINSYLLCVLLVYF